MMRLFGVDIPIPKTPTPTLIDDSFTLDHQSKALTNLWRTTNKVINPISSSTSSSSSSRKGKRKISEWSLVPYYASSSSAPSSALTMLSEERSNYMNLGKKGRKGRPSKEEVEMATSKKPDLSPFLQTKVIETLGIHNYFYDYIPKKIIQKYVFESDIKEDQARLSIPVMELIEKEESFLNKTELGMLNEIGVGEIKVKVMYYYYDGQVLKHKDMKFTRWPKPNMIMPIAKKKEEKKKEKKTSVRYVVQHGWNEVVKDIGLKYGDSIQVWAFRYYSNPHHHDVHDDSLALLLVNLGNSRILAGKTSDR